MYTASLSRILKAAATAVLLVSLPAQAQVQLVDGIAAVVDNDVVMTSELNERVEALYARIKQSGSEPPPKEALVPQVLERLILDRIQIAMAVRAGIRISDDELNAGIARVAENQGMSTDDFIAMAKRDGLSVEVIKEQMMLEMMIKQVQEAQVNRRIQITDQEIDSFLASDEAQAWNSPDVLLGHILLPLPLSASQADVDSTLAKATEIVTQVRQGADFRQMALTYSGDQSALQGGDIGWRKAAQLPEVFIPVATAMEPGQISEPIRSDAGIHLLKLYDRRGAEKQVINQSFVRHILMKPNQIRDDDTTREELEKIADKIRNGADFAELAKDHSEDIGSALSGGELGWSFPGKFVPAFEQVMNDSAIGLVSPPFRTQFGWHILQVTERRNQDFSEEIKRSQAEMVLRKRKFDEELQLWLQEIRDKAFVEIKI